jgi:disulfide bond formation protein DsbB
MSLFEIDFWQRHQRALGIIAIAIGLGAWAMEFAGAVYICPYCRVQRTVIAILGIIMVLPVANHWILKYLASVIGFMGAVVAANQNFMGWAKISNGEFAFKEQLYIDPFLLSGGSLFIIIGMLWLILSKEKSTGQPP